MEIQKLTFKPMLVLPCAIVIKPYLKFTAFRKKLVHLHFQPSSHLAKRAKVNLIGPYLQPHLLLLVREYCSSDKRSSLFIIKERLQQMAEWCNQGQKMLELKCILSNFNLDSLSPLKIQLWSVTITTKLTYTN